MLKFPLVTQLVGDWLDHPDHEGEEYDMVTYPVCYYEAVAKCRSYYETVVRWRSGWSIEHFDHRSPIIHTRGTIHEVDRWTHTDDGSDLEASVRHLEASMHWRPDRRGPNFEPGDPWQGWKE